ncbi:hypothetical protein DMENIID0001_168190 [Sergentomyia squamirostris]
MTEKDMLTAEVIIAVREDQYEEENEAEEINHDFDQKKGVKLFIGQSLLDFLSGYVAFKLRGVEILGHARSTMRSTLLPTSDTSDDPNITSWIEELCRHL